MGDHTQSQVDELQARCTQLEDERRMWKHRAEVYEQAFSALVLHGAEVLFTCADNAEAAKAFYADAAARVSKIVHRADALEADAWTKCAAVARDFVEASVPDERQTIDPWRFIDRWRATFKAALKIEG